MISYNTATIEGAHRFSVLDCGVAMFGYAVGTSRSSEERSKVGDVLTFTCGQHTDGGKAEVQISYRIHSSYG